MSKVMTTLEEILENFPYVLFDSSISQPCGRKFMNYLYEKTLFSSLNKERILEEINGLDDLKMITSSQNTQTIKEVVNEFGKFVELIGGKIAYLSHPERTPHKRILNYYSQRRWDKVYLKGIENRKLLCELQKESYNLFQKYKRRVQKISDARYPLFTEMIKLIDKPIGLKRDFKYREGIVDVPNTTSDTDEKLLAVLYLQIMNNEEDVVLLTRATNFYRLTGVCSRFLGSSEFLPYNQRFRELIKKFPPLIATPYEKGYDVEIFDGIYFEDYFVIQSLPHNESEEIKERLTDLWRKFGDSDYNLTSHNLSLSHQ